MNEVFEQPLITTVFNQQLNLFPILVNACNKTIGHKLVFELFTSFNDLWERF